jgi:lathosterol oxidase
MDIVLECFDKYIFDHIYAAALPAAAPTHFNQTGAEWNPKAASSWQWEPASALLSFQPTDAAYKSAWTRDNLYRQLITLYLITW